MVTASPRPQNTLRSPIRGTAPLEEPPAVDDLEAEEPAVAGDVGVNTADALAKQAVAAALAELTSEGAAPLIVALPAKLQETGFLLFAW